MALLEPFLGSALTRLRSCLTPTPYHSTAVNCGRDANVSDVLAVAWRKAVRRLWQLPYTTHCNILLCLMGGLSAADIMSLRTVNFVMRN